MDKNSRQNVSEKNTKSSTGGKLSNRDQVAEQDTEPGILDRVAESAARLAGSVVRSGTQGAPALDSNMLAEAKSGQAADNSSTMSQEWMAESSTRRGVAASSLYTPEDSASARPSGTSALLFRQAVRAAPDPSDGTYSASGAPLPSSHQVSLADNLDGHGVVEFLAHTMPASMSVGDISGPTSGLRVPARQRGPHRADTVEVADPVTYLQGSSYAADMESSDYRMSQSIQDGPAQHVLQASPIGLARSWDEHGASVLEEWELNEAWDRAWMDTAWTSARKREKAAESKKPERVLPSNRNLSYLLKPRI
ncbi:hypothetical protein LPJ62_000288 [Coemansia sp. RSA 2167]|nr:hypothetical protein LPJ62_000288 [Coemansia sp. RSA 2167]KAJ2154647.1 hypothetical protein J3F82_001029 [Coemansia sp. RSA 637]KAJ2181939.1 hypothetical protein GGF45_001202 [Coemansia sp. RSA 551]KAJ2184389.1 hypothetical protein EV181_004410 [Coemansia sp. RSA 532]KAJ2221790.1 hypothetical protein EV180_004535 [Coemansia sp. RSA 518]KAJ2228243.1 hypothetical protein GGH97_006425 [Coemansia sp. RSA 475]KAJ2270380.1 hypothetical protein J3F81_003913 [Coemansia sp. RSA 371]KAJ2274241.1 hy